MTRYVTFLLALALASPIVTAEAAVIRVPGDRETIQEAVETASPGDTIEVGAGRWCGASIDKRVNIVGRGDAVIAGHTAAGKCAGVYTGGAFKVGLHLNNAASGTKISHLTFDGQGAANDTEALAFAVLGVGASDVTIEHTKVRGTLVGFANLAGDNWTVRHNDIRGLTTRSGAGGVGIVVSQMAASQVRPKNTVIAHNRIEGAVPEQVAMVPGLPAPAGFFAAVRLAGVDGAQLSHNQYRLEAGAGMAKGVGVHVAAGPGSSGGGGRLGPGGGAPGLPSVGVELSHEDGKKADFLAVIHAGCQADVRKSHGTYRDDNTGSHGG